MMTQLQSDTTPTAECEMWKRGKPMHETMLFDYPYGLFLMERLELVLLCQDELEAKILRIVEYEMVRAREVWQALVAAAAKAHKSPPQEPAAYWVRLSHAQFFSRLYKYDTGKIGRQPLSMSK